MVPGQLMVAIAIAIPIILLPVAFVWYLKNLGWLWSGAMKAVGERRAARKKETRAAVRGTW